MKANYGYKDGSGDFFIIVDTDRCSGCGACVSACPARLFVVGEDENDPLNDNPVCTVPNERRREIRYACGACKPIRNRPPLPCQIACRSGAIKHRW